MLGPRKEDTVDSLIRALSAVFLLGAAMSMPVSSATAEPTGAAAKPESTAIAQPESAAAGTRSTPASPAIDVAAQRAAMQKLAYMAGKWQGEGWMESGGVRHGFRGGEIIQEKLGGLALLIEGTFYDLDHPDRQTPVHSTLGVISYVPSTSTYRFLSWLASGRSGEQELVLRENGWEWRLESSWGTIRYVMQLRPGGEWFEIGERSSDGETWHKFFEMTLRKEPPPPSSP
jgi:hypothetical protein